MQQLLIAHRYEVRDLIGQGACGTVLEAMDTRLCRLVALKLIRKGGEEPTRIAAEARAAARLVHPHIVAVHDSGDGRDFAWIAMDLVIGEPLSALLARAGQLNEWHAARIGIQLLDALGHAHGRGVVHRDVKPANILLAMDERDGPGELRLGDFGLAQMGAPDASEAGLMLGTPAWMAPEQVRGEPADHRADLWAAGIVLYQCLTGARPFRGEVPGLLAHILGEAPPPLPAGLDPRWDALMERALAKAPGDRFQSAAEMLAAIPHPARHAVMPELSLAA